jgi:hypothetical protein
MSGKDAYQILLGIGSKPDEELVREFRFASGLTVVDPNPAPEAVNLTLISD